MGLCVQARVTASSLPDIEASPPIFTISTCEGLTTRRDLRSIAFLTQSSNVKMAASPIAKLSVDCLAHMFAFLPYREYHATVRVCRLWQTAQSEAARILAPRNRLKRDRDMIRCFVQAIFLSDIVDFVNTCMPDIFGYLLTAYVERTSPEDVRPHAEQVLQCLVDMRAKASYPLILEIAQLLTMGATKELIIDAFALGKREPRLREQLMDAYKRWIVFCECSSGKSMFYRLADQLSDEQAGALASHMREWTPPHDFSQVHRHTLNFNDSDIVYWPREMTYLTNVDTVSLNHNEFRVLPFWIRYLPNLRIVECGSNLFTQVPVDCICRSHSLQKVFLGKNPLEEEHIRALNPEGKTRYPGALKITLLNANGLTTEVYVSVPGSDDPGLLAS